ncbi:hypothetical protein BJV78DRAFT_1191237 [Lactifluus subvellereus]|nr:hypothetical protein BJV78DRAFT_1191237 [Lactifluus subvellereus]
MKFIRTIVTLSFAVLALAARLDQPQEKRAYYFGDSLEDSAHIAILGSALAKTTIHHCQCDGIDAFFDSTWRC